MKIQHHNLLLPRLFFGSPVFANNMSKDWIVLPTRQQAPTFCVPLPHAPRLCRLLKVPLHGQCAHWKKLHVSQENTYPHCSASEIATSQSTRKYKGAQKGQKSSLAISLNFVLRLNHQLQVLAGQAFGSLEAHRRPLSTALCLGLLGNVQSQDCKGKKHRCSSVLIAWNAHAAVIRLMINCADSILVSDLRSESTVGGLGSGGDKTVIPGPKYWNPISSSKCIVLARQD